MRIPLLIVLILVLVMAPFAMAQRTERTLTAATPLYPGTPQYFPDGNVASDTAWILNAKYDPNYLITLFVLTDSIAGYAAADDSIKIDVLYGPDDATAGYLPLNLTTQVLCNQQLQSSVPSDSGFYMTFTPPPHDRRRYYVSNSTGDTMSVAIKEIVNTAAPWKR